MAISFRKSVLLGFCVCLCFLVVSTSTSTTASSEESRPSPQESCPSPIVVPVARLREGRHVLGSSQHFMTEFPCWANRTLLALGQRFVAENFFGYAYGVAVLPLMSVVDTQRVLISGGNTTDVHKAAKRYLIDLLHFWYWATAELDTEELYESLNLIHVVHAKMGHEASRKYHLFEEPLIPTPPRGANPYNLNTRVWDALERDLLASPLRATLREIPIYPPRNGQTIYPLNQFAMATQLLSFTGLAVISPERTSMSDATHEQLTAYLHFWAFVGHGVGIQDEYNVCLQPDLGTAQIYFRDVLKEYFLPRLFDITYEHKVVVENVIKAIEAVVLQPSVMDVLFYRMCVDALDIECPSLYQVMSPQSRALNKLLEIGKPVLRSGSSKIGLNFLLNSFVICPETGSPPLSFQHTILSKFYGWVTEVGQRNTSDEWYTLELETVTLSLPAPFLRVPKLISIR